MPEKMTLHYKDGSTVVQDAVDARRTLIDHPSEYSAKPFPEEIQEAAKEEEAEIKDALVKIRLSGEAPHRIDAALAAFNEMQQARKKQADAAVRSGKPHPIVAGAKSSGKKFEAKHRGQGSYSIFDAAGNKVLDKLTQDDAELFNSSAEESQEEYIRAEKAKRASA